MPTWKKAYHANCWGALGGAPVGVTSIKDLYYRTFGDMNRAITDIGSAGYEGIELFDGNLLDYEAKSAELRQRLSSYVHLKDFRRDPFAFLPLGDGELGMEKILRALVTIN